jgi:hypothetical protein
MPIGGNVVSWSIQNTARRLDLWAQRCFVTPADGLSPIIHVADDYCHTSICLGSHVGGFHLV